MNGIERIAAERQRQVEAEGWSPEHDDQHTLGELAEAAACYAMNRFRDTWIWHETLIHRLWPWEAEDWKPVPGDPAGRIRELEKAGALVAAEIDRLLRLGDARTARRGA